MENKKSGFAIASLVLGILSLTLCCACNLPLGLLGLIFGIVSLSKKESRKGMAIGGVVTSSIALILGVIMMLGYLFFQEEVKNEITKEINAYDEGDYYYDDSDDYDDDTYDDDDDDYDDTDVTVNTFAGYSYVCGDGSVCYFEEDGTFIWYQSDDNHDDNYYEGTYDVYYGEDAIEFVTEDLAEYSVTEDELDDYFDRNSDSEFYQESNFCSLVLHNDILFTGGEEQDLGKDTYYMGFFADGYYDAVNMITTNYASFTLVE